MTHAVAEGTVRGMIVSGPPGVGKSFGVETVLEDYDMLTRSCWSSLQELK